MDGELLEHIGPLRVKVESHLREPLEIAGAGDLVGQQHPGGVALVNQLCDLEGEREK